MAEPPPAGADAALKVAQALGQLAVATQGGGEQQAGGVAKDLQRLVDALPLRQERHCVIEQVGGLVMLLHLRLPLLAALLALRP